MIPRPTPSTPSPDLYKSGIKSLALHNFRNYSARKFEFSADKVVFAGDNGRGKTNILEAISVFSVGKSWREISSRTHTSPDSYKSGLEIKKCNLIQSDSENPAIIEVETSEEDFYQIQIFPHQRVFQKNGKKIPRKNHLGQVPTLLFAPEHLGIFSAPKRERQRFFDRFLCQIYPRYKDLLIQTLRVVKQKNAIFREISSERELEIQLAPWNEILQKNIPEIWKFRENFLDELRPFLQSELKKIAGNKDIINVFLTRAGSEKSENQARTYPGSNLPKLELDFKKEMKIGRSIFSPTRDDFSFHYRGEPIMNTVSRGEIRSVLLALLSSKKQLFFAKKGVMPILLLDDCFSELDDNRRQGLEHLCENTQAFFTTTHKEHFAKFSGEVQEVEV